MQLPFTELTEEVKVAKTRLRVTLQQSKDECISKANIAPEAGRKLNIGEEVEEAKLRLRMQDITGVANKGRLGLGWEHIPVYNTSSDYIKKKDDS